MSAPRYRVDPWRVQETVLPDRHGLAETESVFALSNGLVGVRGVLDEGEPCGMPGTYLNSFFDEREMSYPETGYGFPERTQIVVSAPEATLLRLRIDGDPFDVRSGTLRHHERELDLRAGVLRRSVEWVSPSGVPVRVSSSRLVSLTQPAVLAIRYHVETLDAPAGILVESDLSANPELPEPDSDDPRAPTTVQSPLIAQRHDTHRAGGLLVHRTQHSGQRVAAAVTHLFDAEEVSVSVTTDPDLVRTVLSADLPPRSRFTVTKFAAYAWSAGPDPAQLAGRATAALEAAARTGWEGLLAEQRRHLDAFWADADVELDGDPPVQQAARFGLFHLLQATAATGQRPVPAKGLTGNGYDGHTMWDVDMFVQPVLTYLRPEAAAGPLRWRHATLPQARARARELRLAGAAFPWRTIDGRECSGYWPAGSAALHVNADIAAAVLRYVAATGDSRFLREAGLELLVETARLWCRVGYFDDAGAFHIDGVTGPDEYTALGNDNLYTNLMARQNLSGAADAARRHPDRATELRVTDEEVAAWSAAAEAMHVPYDDKRDVHQQCAGFTDWQEWDFAATGSDEYPLLLHYPYQELYRRQVVKQADVVLAMHHCGDAFTPEQKVRNFAYYERRTVRDSSLSAASQAILAAEVGYLQLAHAYLGESALQDLRNLSDTTGDGLHLAALAGAWSTLVMGFGGFRDHRGRLAFAPRLPDGITRLRFGLFWQGRRIGVTVTPGHATYLLRDGEPDRTVRLTHHGSPVTLVPGEPRTLAIPELVAPGDAPPPPPGRGPHLRTAGHDV